MPMADPDEAAAMVNALQRHATVVVQKSIAEGFCLTVAEAMWKSRPVVGSAVGGIDDQIVHQEHGLLVEDPTDVTDFGRRRRGAPTPPCRGSATRAQRAERASAEYLGDRHLEQYGQLFAQLR
jgi:trehalose synthase